MKKCREAYKFVTHTFKRDEKEPLKNVEKRLERAAHDAASLRSLAPSPQGLTNDDEVGAQSADGVSDSRVRVQLPSDRRANKFDRGFPSVDDSEYYFNYGAAATSIVMTAQKENSNEDEVAESAVKALVLFKLKIRM